MEHKETHAGDERIFRRLLGSALIVGVTNNLIWFALTYWIYLQTRSVISTAFLGGIFMIAAAVSGFWFGAIVDHHRKKRVMLASSAATLILFSIGLAIYSLTPKEAFTTVASPILWIFVLILMSGVVSGNLYNISIPTLVTLLVPEDRRDKANGMLGTTMGVVFSITSFISGAMLAFLGLAWVITVTIISTIIAIIYLLTIPIPEKRIIHTDGHRKVDIRGTVKAIQKIPGLFALIFFTTFNNLLGGVFMALMDAYGLSLVSVQVWGALWGFLSFGFIVGGIFIARKGLGKNPLRTLFLVNIVLWINAMLMVIQPSVILLAIGGLIWMTLVPFVEATEQTIIQKVVPQERQGRVFGFAHSIEQSASPLTAFIIGPIAQFFFIPFMTTGRGVELIGNWFGTGTGRGIALVFIMAGIIGLIVTIIAMGSRPYRLLSERYAAPGDTK